MKEPNEWVKTISTSSKRKCKQ